MGNPEIKNRFNGNIIIPAGKYASIKEAVEKEYKNLSSADLSYANLSYANLSSADLRHANLSSADLRYANLSYAKNLKIHFQIIPSEGSFIAWKAAKDCLVKIVIPNDAKRTSCLVNRKCRAEYVKTIAIYKPDGTTKLPDNYGAIGKHDPTIVYRVGQITKADKFDDSIFVDCSHGIHFFITKEEAIEWINQ